MLEWAGEPLATAEVAAVCAIDRDEARQRLGRVADEEHVGFDGFWYPAGTGPDDYLGALAQTAAGSA